MTPTEAMCLPAAGGAVVVALDIPDGAPVAVREGMVRRRLTMTEGRCPCGAVLRRPNRAARRRLRGQVLVVDVAHEPDCPATSENLRSALAAWNSR